MGFRPLKPVAELNSELIAFLSFHWPSGTALSRSGLRPGGLERLNRIDHGFTFKGALLPPAKVSWQSEARLRFALKGEVPGQIAYMCESVGLRVEAMKRLRVGRVSLSQLAPDQWRYLMPNERF